MIDCDEDALVTEYSCRQGSCIPVPVSQGGDFKDKSSCEAACS